MSEPRSEQIDSLDIAMVQHIATLARLDLSDEQAELFSRQLTSILDYVNHLAEVDVEGVEPGSPHTASRSTLRGDEVAPSLPREEFLAIVPRHSGGLVRVPPVFGA
jgi:aspartyl-tRNA(Asn)/glutamyl-tRNA(Gln) amidotransferase subunit C